MEAGAVEVEVEVGEVGAEAEENGHFIDSETAWRAMPRDPGRGQRPGPDDGTLAARRDRQGSRRRVLAADDQRRQPERRADRRPDECGECNYRETSTQIFPYSCRSSVDLYRRLPLGT